MTGPGRFCVRKDGLAVDIRGTSAPIDRCDVAVGAAVDQAGELRALPVTLQQEAAAAAPPGEPSVLPRTPWGMFALLLLVVAALTHGTLHAWHSEDYGVTGLAAIGWAVAVRALALHALWMWRRP